MQYNVVLVYLMLPDQGFLYVNSDHIGAHTQNTFCPTYNHRGVSYNYVAVLLIHLLPYKYLKSWGPIDGQ